MAAEKNPKENCLNNNLIKMRDANQNREQIACKLSAAEKAEEIGHKLKRFKGLCKDQIRKQHTVETIVRISIYMAQQYQLPDWHRFDILLIKHLRLLLELQEDHRTEFERLFTLVSEIFWYFCIVDKIAHHFVNQLLDIWQQMLLKVDLEIKKNVFMTKKRNFENCVRFMKRVGCYAMQRKMLNIILSYVEAIDQGKFIMVSSLFHVIGTSTHGVYKKLIQLHQAVATGAASVESKNRYIIQILNEFGAGTVVSKLIENVWFDGKMVTLFPDFEAWIDFNLGTKTIEFSFVHEGERKMARIDKYCVGLFKIDNSDTESVSSVFEIDMINPMHFETMDNTTAHDVIILTQIRIKLTYGILTEQLESMLENLLPNQFEFVVAPAKKEKSKNENGASETIGDDDLLLVEDDIPDPIPPQNVPKSQIKRIKFETKANIKNETKTDTANASFLKPLDFNVIKRYTRKKSTLTTTETSVHHEVTIKTSRTKVEKLESVPNIQPDELSKELTETPIERTENPSEPIEQFGQTDDIPIDYDDILGTETVETKNSVETEVKTNETVVKAIVHCDIAGNSQCRKDVPKSDTKSQRKAIKPTNYDEITSIEFDQRHFDQKVAKKITSDLNSNKENRFQIETSVIEEKVEPTIVKQFNNKNNNQQKKIPVKKARVTKPKPKPIIPKNETETDVRRSSRKCSAKAQQRMAEQKDDVYEYVDDYDEFAIPAPPKPKRKSNRSNSSTKNETKAPVKRASSIDQVNEEPKVKKPRKLYSKPIEFDDFDDDAQPQVIEKPSPSKMVVELEDDQLTTASFDSGELKGIDSVLNRVTKNLVRIEHTEEAKIFNDLFETPCYERGQINEKVTFSYRKYATRNSYSRVGMSTDSEDETKSKNSKTAQAEDE